MVNILIKIIIIIACSFSFLSAQNYNDDINSMLKIFNEIRDNENLYSFEIDDRLNNIADIRSKENCFIKIG